MTRKTAPKPAAKAAPATIAKPANELDALAARKHKPLSELLAGLHLAQKRAEDEDQGLTKLGTQFRGKDAHVRLINLQQKEAIDFAGTASSGELDFMLLARSRSMLIAFSVVDASGAPIFKDYQDVDVRPEVGDALWTICAKINRIGIFRDVDPVTNQAIAGN